MVLSSGWKIWLTSDTAEGKSEDLHDGTQSHNAFGNVSQPFRNFVRELFVHELATPVDQPETVIQTSLRVILKVKGGSSNSSI